MACEQLGALCGRGAQQRADIAHRHAAAAQQQDLLQPIGVRAAVQPIAAFAAARGRKQPRLLVKAQCARGDPRHARELPDAVFVHGPSFEFHDSALRNGKVKTESSRFKRERIS